MNEIMASLVNNFDSLDMFMKECKVHTILLTEKRDEDSDPTWQLQRYRRVRLLPVLTRVLVL